MRWIPRGAGAPVALLVIALVLAVTGHTWGMSTPTEDGANIGAGILVLVAEGFLLIALLALGIQLMLHIVRRRQTPSR
jgi:hypothetical protein